MKLCQLPSTPDRTSKVVCRCLGVTEDDITRALKQNPISTVRELRACTGAGGGCMCCHRDLLALIAEHVPAESGRRLALPSAG